MNRVRDFIAFREILSNKVEFLPLLFLYCKNTLFLPIMRYKNMHFEHFYIMKTNTDIKKLKLKLSVATPDEVDSLLKEAFRYYGIK